MQYCVRQKAPFTLFDDWSSIHMKVKEIVDGKTTVQDAAKDGYQQYQRGEAGVNGQAK